MSEPVRFTDWIQLASGKPFWPIEPLAEDIDIDDIAHGLSYQCRYNGHVTQFYSVAEHSYLVSLAVERVAPELALWGLLHDAEEALGLPDLPRPVKRQISEYGARGYSIMHRVSQRFNLSWPEPDIVKEMDTRILFNEKEAVLKPSVIPWSFQGEPIPNITIHCWNPETAKSQFLYRFNQLYKD